MDPDTANPFPEPGAGLLLFLASLALGGFVALNLAFPPSIVR